MEGAMNVQDNVRNYSIQAVRNVLGAMGHLPPHLASVAPTSINQNASVARVAYALWSREITRDALTERDIIRMQALGIWIDGQFTVEAQDIFSAATAAGSARAQSDERERQEVETSRQMIAAMAEAELVNIAVDIMRNEKAPA